MRRTARLPLTMLFAALVLAGCTTPAPMPTAPPAPSEAPVFASDEEALAAAEEAYGAFLATSDAIIRDGGNDPDRLRPFVSEAIYEREAAGFAALNERSLHGVGATTFTLILQRHDERELTLYACNDYSETDVIDDTGISVLRDSRETLKPFEVAMDPRDSLRLVRMEAWDGGGVC